MYCESCRTLICDIWKRHFFVNLIVYFILMRQNLQVPSAWFEIAAEIFSSKSTEMTLSPHSTLRRFWFFWRLWSETVWSIDPAKSQLPFMAKLIKYFNILFLSNCKLVDELVDYLFSKLSFNPLTTGLWNFK